MTTLQSTLGTIVKNRIDSDNKKGVLATTKDEIQNILDVFLAGDRLTLDQYNELKTYLGSLTTATTV